LALTFRHTPTLTGHREEFSLSSAADDLNSAVSKASIPAGAFAIAAVALLGLVYLVVGLLFG
jgi:hypothetical protein